jgi:putative hydrolase of the HAD superfamily
MIQAVCFDLDDTLFDYREYAESGLCAAADRLESRTGESFHQALLALYFEEGITHRTFDTFLDRQGLPSHLATELVEAYHAATTPLSPYEETEPTLSELSEDYALGLVTDGRGGDAKLRRLGIRECFDAVLVTPTIGYSKLDPEAFDIVLSELGVSPGDAVYVGDDPRFDVAVPNDIGMTTVRLRRGRHADRPPESGSAVPDDDIDGLGELTGSLRMATREQ